MTDLCIQLAPGVPSGLGAALSAVGVQVRVASLPVLPGTHGVVILAADLGAAGEQPGSIGLLALIEHPSEAVAASMSGASSALRSSATDSLVAAAVAVAERFQRLAAPSGDDALVDTLHAQLRALTERRQGWEHEVRTPLGIIRSNAANLRDGIDGPVTPDQRESIDSILSASTQLEHLLERDRYTRPNLPAIPSVGMDQRQGSRVASGGSGRTLVSLVPLVRRVLGQFMAGAERQGVVLRLSAPSDLASVWLDEVKITQLLSNLVGNALKHSKNAELVQVLVREEAPGTLPMAGVRITVQDSGEGVPADMLERIFERGVRGASHPDAPPGRGLGLTVSRDLVAAHGGELWAENLAEGGAAFHAVLPVDLRSGRRRR